MSGAPLLAVIQKDIRPVADREYVWIPEGAGVGDVVAYKGAYGITDAMGIGIVCEVWPDAYGLYAKGRVGETIRWWKGPGMEWE